MFSTEVDKLLPALVKVKAKLQGVTKGANNPFFKSKYADLNTYLDAVEPLLAENGLILLQPVSIDHMTGRNTVSSLIMHSSGQFIQSSMNLVGDVDMQKLGSGVTYARRYTLGSLLSMQAVDDDGEGAIGRTKTASTAVTTTTTLANGPAQTEAPRRPSFRKNAAPAAVVSEGDDI